MSRSLILTDNAEAVLAALDATGTSALIALGQRLVSADGADDAAAVPGALAAIDESDSRIPDVEALLADPAQAREALGGLFGVDGEALDDETLGDALGWLHLVGAEFTALIAEPLGDGEPWPFPGGCLTPEIPPVPPPESPLRAARFAGDPVLEACLAGTHRMLAPERGNAVLKVQQALLDLGFTLPEHGADAIFGTETGTAVSEFKRGQGLVPDDPVVGPGTMRALDGLFA
jgi:hypothetical protein